MMTGAFLTDAALPLHSWLFLLNFPKHPCDYGTSECWSAMTLMFLILDCPSSTTFGSSRSTDMDAVRESRGVECWIISLSFAQVEGFGMQQQFVHPSFISFYREHLNLIHIMKVSLPESNVNTNLSGTNTIHLSIRLAMGSIFFFSSSGWSVRCEIHVSNQVIALILLFKEHEHLQGSK